MADSTAPAWRGLQSLFNQSQTAAQQQAAQAGQPPPAVGGAPGVPQPYDPTTGLPTPTTPTGAPPAATNVPASTGPSVESRRGIGHFGGGDTTAANNAADAAASGQ